MTELGLGLVGVGLGLVKKFIQFEELIVVVQACGGGTRGTSVQCQRCGSSGIEAQYSIAHTYRSGVGFGIPNRGPYTS